MAANSATSLDGNCPDVGPEDIIPGDKKGCSGLAVYGDHIFLGCPADGTLRVISRPTKQERKRFEVGFKAMYESHRVLFVVMADFRILVFSMSMKMPVAVLDGHTKWITSVSIQQDVAVSSSADMSVCVWDIGQFFSTSKDMKKLTRDQKALKQMVAKYDTDKDTASAMNSSNESESSLEEITEHAVEVDENESPVEAVARARTVVPLARLTGHTDTVTATAIVLSFVVTASADCSLRLWDLEGNNLQTVKNAHSDWITHIMSSRTSLYTTGRDSLLKEWRLVVKKKLGFKGKESFALKEVRSTKFESRPSKLHIQRGFVLVATADHVITQYSKSGSQVMKYEGHTGNINAMYCDPFYTNFFWSASDDKKMIKWSVETGNAICVYKGHKDAIQNIYCVDQKLMTTSKDGDVLVWSRRIDEDKLRWYSSNKAMSKEEQEQKMGWYSGDKSASPAKKSKGPPARSEEEQLSWYM